MLHLSLALAMGLVAGSAAAQDLKPEIENNWVSVFRVHQAHGEHLALGQRTPFVVVFLTDAHERVTAADGKSQEVRHQAGETGYIDGALDSAENLSDRPMEAILIELKPARIHSVPVTLDPVKLDPKYHIVDFENDRVRILRTILEPHIKSPMHEHPAYVVVYLTELHTTMKLGDGRVVDNPRRPGEIAWRDPLKHETENIGDHTAVEIQVELK